MKPRILTASQVELEYQKGVELVKLENKASVSFIQRRLQIGYTQAAQFIERMEVEEIISKADREGKRHVTSKV